VVTRQQDGALSLRSIYAFAILHTDVLDFIEPSNWPSNSPDLNLVDYSIWAALHAAADAMSEVQKRQPSETSPEQLLWDVNKQELINGAIEPVV